MKGKILYLFLFFLIVLTAGTAYMHFFGGHHHHEKSMVVRGAWSRPLPPAAVNGAAYVQLHNLTAEADRLIGGSSDIAAEIQFHDHVMTDGLMKMVRLPESIPLAIGEEYEFLPGGKHIMLMGLTKPLVKGENFLLTLHFERAGDRQVEVKITDEPEGTGQGDHSGH